MLCIWTFSMLAIGVTIPIHIPSDLIFSLQKTIQLIHLIFHRRIQPGRQTFLAPLGRWGYWGLAEVLWFAKAMSPWSADGPSASGFRGLMPFIAAFHLRASSALTNKPALDLGTLGQLLSSPVGNPASIFSWSLRVSWVFPRGLRDFMVRSLETLFIKPTRPSAPPHLSTSVASLPEDCSRIVLNSGLAFPWHYGFPFITYIYERLESVLCNFDRGWTKHPTLECKAKAGDLEITRHRELSGMATPAPDTISSEGWLQEPLPHPSHFCRGGLMFSLRALWIPFPFALAWGSVWWVHSHPHILTCPTAAIPLPQMINPAWAP